MALAEQRRAGAGRRRAPAFDQFFAVRRFQPTLAFSPDSRSVLFSTDVSGQFNLWRASVRGGAPRQLTAFERESVRSVTVSPDGKEIVLTADRDGDEFTQIYALPWRGGWPEPWTDAAEVQHFVGRDAWSPDGARLAFGANARVPADVDVWIRERESGEVRRLFGEEMFALPASWSPDGTQILVSEDRFFDATLHLVDAASGEGREVTPHEGELKFVAGPWARDGSGFYLLTDAGREFVGLAFYRLDAGRYEWLETPEGDVEGVDASADGRYLAWLVNERGWSRLYVRDLETGELMPQPELPDGCCVMSQMFALSPDGRYAALIWTQPRRAMELYVVELATGRARRLTDSMLGGLRERDLVAPEEVAYPSFDGREIPAWLFRPRGRGRRPAVLAIHGGPEWQERPWYHPLYQYLLSRGIAILAPNIRGSTGYGSSYQKLVRHDWGGGDLEDMRHAAEWLRAQAWVDPERIAVYGGSYGGFATLSCLTRLPEYWAAGVDVVGPSNLVTLVETGPPHWRRFDNRLIGDPDTEADFLLERSPITYVENVRAPLLVLQGANDPRVPKGESDQMVERLRALGREVEYAVFDDEGHGFTKRANQVRGYRLAADWLERHLLAAGAHD